MGSFAPNPSNTLNTLELNNNDLTPEQEAETVDIIANVLKLFWSPGEVRELRIPGAKLSENYKATMAGYYNNLRALARDTIRWSGAAPGVYLTLNPVNPNFLSSCKNRVDKLRSTATDN